MPAAPCTSAFPAPVLPRRLLRDSPLPAAAPPPLAAPRIAPHPALQEHPPAANTQSPSGLSPAAESAALLLAIAEVKHHLQCLLRFLLPFRRKFDVVRIRPHRAVKMILRHGVEPLSRRQPPKAASPSLPPVAFL